MTKKFMQQICKYCQYSPRYNQFNLEMIPEYIRKQLFNKRNEPISESDFKRCIIDFKKHRFDITKIENHNKNLNLLKKLSLPPIINNDIEDHFWQLGTEQSKPYRHLIDEFLKSKTVPKPKKWLMVPGWTKYVSGMNPVTVKYPEENVFVLDVEVCVQNGPSPIMATALSPNAWYCWISPLLTNGTILRPTQDCHFDDLIQIEDTLICNTPRLMIGHNVSYDRIRIREQYKIDNSALRFMDTMALHICISGITSLQRNAIKLKLKDIENQDNNEQELSSLNNLSEVAKLYCKKILTKDTREIFVKGNLSDIREKFNELVDYCSCDTEATADVFRCIYPIFLERFPHPVTLAGMLELGTAYLPVNKNWQDFIKDSDMVFDELENDLKTLLVKKANDACRLLHNDQYKKDLWLWNEDWSIQNFKLKKIKKQKIKENETLLSDINNEINNDIFDIFGINKLKHEFDHLFNKNILPKKMPFLPGYPKWYRKLCKNTSPILYHISTSMRIIPLLLNLTWEGYPLYFHKDFGWGFLVPFTQDLRNVSGEFPLKELLEKCSLKNDLNNKNFHGNDYDSLVQISNKLKDKTDREIFWKKSNNDINMKKYKETENYTETIIENCCWFVKLPHKDGDKFRVGNPLSKEFIKNFGNKLSGDDVNSVQYILQVSKTLSYWRNNRDRILNQLVIWSNNGQLNSEGINNLQYGAILPQVLVSGTLTRRAVERCWMTASNAQPDRIGSELRAMIQAPKNYCIIGADVDSQELWIAGLLGDSFCAKVAGCTPFSWMTLKGNKSDKTDMHSVTAQAINISRDHAKVINYARIYGAGQSFAEQLLRQFNPSLNVSQARNKARKMFNMTKGQKFFKLKPEYLKLLDPDCQNRFTIWQALELTRFHNKRIPDMFEDGKWIGGTESEMFNCLENIANRTQPKTPFLESRLSRALEPKALSAVDRDRFLHTRINWVVQSGAVDFLHLMLVSMRWLMGNQIRFCLSFHDEVRYLVPEHAQNKAVIAMHLTNLLTRAFCSSKVGIYDLPMSVAFFSSVEVDQVLRKDASDNCITPSNPEGLQKKLGINNGQSIDIFQAIKMSENNID